MIQLADPQTGDNSSLLTGVIPIIPYAASPTTPEKEDEFFDIIEEKSSLSEQENEMLIKHFENCRNQIGGAIRIQQMMKNTTNITICPRGTNLFISAYQNITTT